ncbi:hypothetical protein ACPVPU_02405 [Sphingomonas sp. CJ99]
MMDMIDRYLDAVRGNLPARRSDDIAAELDAELRDRIDARQLALGRPLDGDEIADLLRSHGHPLLVAWRYRDRQQLLGAETYPFFHFTLRIILLVAAMLALVGFAGVILLGGAHPADRLLNIAAQGFQGVLTAIGVTVVLFWILDRLGFPADHLRRWRPEHLPVLSKIRLGTANALIQLALILAFILWWMGVVAMPMTATAPMRIEAAFDLTGYRWPVLVLAGLQAALIALQWLAPASRWRGLALGLFTGGALWTLSSYAAAGAASGEWLRIVATPGNMGLTASQDALNLAARLGIVAMAVTLIVVPLVELYQLWRSKRSG